MRRLAFAITTLMVLAAALVSLSGCESTGTRIKGLEPAFGNVSGGDTVIILGSGFTHGMAVQFGKSEVKHVVLDSPSRLRVKTPSGPEGKTDVVVTRDDGKTFVLRGGFTYRSEATTE